MRGQGISHQWPSLLGFAPFIDDNGRWSAAGLLRNVSRRVQTSSFDFPSEISGSPLLLVSPVFLARHGVNGFNLRDRISVFSRWLEGATGSKAQRSYRLRILIQSSIALTCIWIGFAFVRFYRAAAAGQIPLPQRPPGVEGFLPISGVMGLIDWIYSGHLNSIHPAATILVLIGLVLTFVLRKSFCSWICPIGLLSEILARGGRSLFGRNFRLWRWADVLLRSMKYLIMAFFLWSIFSMGRLGLAAFIDSPYNRVTDLKMGLFFAHLSLTALAVLVVLAVGSMFVQGLWCRYFCPYGALLGLFSFLSPTRIVRDPASCIDCGLCDKVCMARLPVSRAKNVINAECTGCLDCLAVCPVGEALTVRTAGKRWKPARFALVVFLIFFLAYLGARGTGLWKNEISDNEYIQRVEQLNSGIYSHAGR